MRSVVCGASVSAPCSQPPCRLVEPPLLMRRIARRTFSLSCNATAGINVCTCVVVRDDGEPIVRHQSVEHEFRTALGFRERRAGHRAGAVDHQREVQRVAARLFRGRVGRLHAHQHVEFVVVTGEQGSAARGDQQGGQ